jgi:uncharacterized membrane-anchored protein
MRPITIIRGIAWIGVAVAATALMVRWGTDDAVRSGPPSHWEREVVGGLVLAAIAAVLLMFGGAESRQRWFTRGIAAAAAAATVWIALSLRSSALVTGFPDLIAGPGWTWLMAGGAVTLGAAVLSLLLPAHKRKVKVGGKKARRRRR